MTQYSILKGLTKLVKFVVIFLVAGLIVGLKPEIQQLTLGGLLVLLLNYIKVQWDIKFLG